jgi:hypothetical protein
MIQIVVTHRKEIKVLFGLFATELIGLAPDDE